MRDEIIVDEWVVQLRVSDGEQDLAEPRGQGADYGTSVGAMPNFLALVVDPSRDGNEARVVRLSLGDAIPSVDACPCSLDRQAGLCDAAGQAVAQRQPWRGGSGDVVDRLSSCVCCLVGFDALFDQYPEVCIEPSHVVVDSSVAC